MLAEAASSFIFNENEDGLWKRLMKSTAHGSVIERERNPDRMTLSVSVL
jgi:hypothetical protein